jgi:hypothetical protein
MKMRIALAALVAVFLVLPMAIGAQAKTVSALLAYFENNSKKFQVLDESTPPKPVTGVKEGMELKPGWTIKTGKGDVAEVKLTHNGTIIKISQNTTFTVKALGDTKDKPNVLKVAAGKIRTVAGKATGDQRYRVEGGAAVCGVSGTDFVYEVASYDEMLYVLNGLVSYFKDTSPDKLIPVGAGEMMSFEDFTVRAIPASQLEQLKYENAFKQLVAEDVAQSTDGGTNAFEAGKADVWDKIKEILGMEIGSIVIEGDTWSKIVVQPKFKIGKMKVGLYLPLIYRGNMFDPEDWYHPNGNDEWSFGFDQVGVVDTVTDAVSDVFLKIRYFEWSDPRNPPFLKVGNLDDITIGHGLIMRDFANDAYFPAIRRVGLNLGFDLGKFGFEYMVNDAGNLLTLPVVFSDPTFVPDVLTGGRIYFQPLDDGKKHDIKTIKDLAFGVSLLADIGASAGFDDPVVAGEPIFLNPGVDLDVPIFESKPFSIVAFADAALMVPYFRYGVHPADLGLSGSDVPSGLAWKAVYNPDADIAGGEVPFKNYGVAAGLFGNIFFVDWRLEYRYFTGVFKPAFYNAGYEASRSRYVTEVVDYLANMSDPRFNALTMGVYGEGGFTWDKICSLDIGYFWPWDASGTIPFEDMEDRFIAKFTLEPGVIPVVHISGSVSYERTGFAQTLIGGGDATLFDANTVVKAELVYPLAPTLDIALTYTTTPLLDADGKPQYDGSTWLPKMITNMTFETRVHF